MFGLYLYNSLRPQITLKIFLSHPKSYQESGDQDRRSKRRAFNFQHNLPVNKMVILSPTSSCRQQDPKFDCQIHIAKKSKCKIDISTTPQRKFEMMVYIFGYI